MATEVTNSHLHIVSQLDPLSLNKDPRAIEAASIATSQQQSLKQVQSAIEHLLHQLHLMEKAMLAADEGDGSRLVVDGSDDNDGDSEVSADQAEEQLLLMQRLQELLQSCVELKAQVRALDVQIDTVSEQVQQLVQDVQALQAAHHQQAVTVVANGLIDVADVSENKAFQADVVGVLEAVKPHIDDLLQIHQEHKQAEAVTREQAISAKIEAMTPGVSQPIEQIMMKWQSRPVPVAKIVKELLTDQLQVRVAIEDKLSQARQTQQRLTDLISEYTSVSQQLATGMQDARQLQSQLNVVTSKQPLQAIQTRALGL